MSTTHGNPNKRVATVSGDNTSTTLCGRVELHLKPTEAKRNEWNRFGSMRNRAKPVGARARVPLGVGARVGLWGEENVNTQ